MKNGDLVRVIGQEDGCHCLRCQVAREGYVCRIVGINGDNNTIVNLESKDGLATSAYIDELVSVSPLDRLAFECSDE